MAATARVHRLQIELSGSTIKLHGVCVREIDDPNGSKVEAGNCDVEIEVTAPEVQALLDKAKAELARVAALPESDEATKMFDGLPIS